MTRAQPILIQANMVYFVGTMRVTSQGHYRPERRKGEIDNGCVASLTNNFIGLGIKSIPPYLVRKMRPVFQT